MYSQIFIWGNAKHRMYKSHLSTSCEVGLFMAKKETFDYRRRPFVTPAMDRLPNMGIMQM